MHTLLLKLSGPLQSWGSGSKYRFRDTDLIPTKSGVLGMIASALGRQRGEKLDDLAALSFAVRVDQPGSLLRDYQTAIDWSATSQSDRNPKLSTRLYLSDAKFVVALGGEPEFLLDICKALKEPMYPLFLGRRSCPAGHDLVIGIHDESPLNSLADTPWLASKVHKRKLPQQVSLLVLRDATPDENGDLVRDVPISFAQENRKHSWREIIADKPITVQNPSGFNTDDLFFPEVAKA